MACNVCGCTVKKCENSQCDKTFDPSNFLCYQGDLEENYHFCDRSCFQEWLDSEHCNKLEEAEDNGT